MIILKEVIHFPDTNSVEATWVDRTVTQQTVIDEDGAETVQDVTTDVQIKCHSYADVQMQMLRDDAAALGTSLDDYEDLIASVEAAMVPYVPPPPVIPQSISMRQARLALLAAGLLDQVNAGMATMPQSAQIEWEFASEVRRDNALIGAMATALGLDDEALDSLFTAGALL